MNQQPKKLLDQVRDVMRVKHYSIRTEQAYVDWIKRYILFHGKRHPQEMGVPEIEAFLTHLAIEQNVAASTQNQALSALLFLYREVLEMDLGSVDAIATWIAAMAQSISPTLSNASTPTSTVNGVGSTSFPLRAFP